MFRRSITFSGRCSEKRLYLENHRMHKHRTFTIVLLRTCTVVGGVHAKNMEKSTVRLKVTRPVWHSTTPLSARSSYENENRARSRRVMGLPDVAENSPRVASEKQHGAASDNTLNLPNIAVSEFYFWQTITPEANVREAPKLERTVRGIHTIDGGSRPLPVWYVFRASPSGYWWWSIIDCLLYYLCSQQGS